MNKAIRPTLSNMATDTVIQQSDIKQSRVQSFAFVIATSASVLFSACFAACCLVGFRLPEEIELEARINPNYAPIASLVRLPGVGIARAEAIVAYRENWGAQESNRATFEDCNDLQKVKGIGPKIVQNISEWLKFE